MIRNIIITLSALLVSVVLVSPVSADVNDFRITDYTIDYQLSRDDDGRSVLVTTETITAQFPQIDQNHGIERAIPSSYDGHPVDLDITSVATEAGDRWNHTSYNTNGNTVLRIGDADKYVHGLQTYVIEYRQRDVTKSFSNTSDEFYWDTNGTEWRVPIDKLTVSLTIADDLVTELTGQTACYFGSAGSNESCALEQLGNKYSVGATNLAPGQNITIAIGFSTGTFAEYEMPLWQKVLIVWAVLQVILVVVSVGLIIWLALRFANISSRRSELHPIAPEYLPPSDASVEVSAKLLGKPSAFSALLVDLAVRRYINIIEVKPKATFRAAEYELEVIKSVEDLRPEELEIVKDTFYTVPEVGEKQNLKQFKDNSLAYVAFTDNSAKLKGLVRGEYGLKQKDPKQSAWFSRFGWRSLMVALLTLSPLMFIVSMVAFVMGQTLWVLTDKGLALLRYLKGLEMYIKVAEEERLKMLQGPTGAEKVGVVDSEAKLVKLYEKLLPYAVLFGLEKQWNQQLGRYYETTNTQPDWYVSSSHTAFSAAAFSSAMSGFRSSAGYSSPTSSSSGGSGGGGSSGGGGGGGGGGGW